MWKPNAIYGDNIFLYFQFYLTDFIYIFKISLYNIIVCITSDIFKLVTERNHVNGKQIGSWLRTDIFISILKSN